MSLNVTNVTTFVPTSEIGPGPLADCLTPPAVLVIAVNPEAHYWYDEGVITSHGVTKWYLDQGVAQTYIPMVLDSLNTFRERHSPYLNLFPNEFQQHLENCRPIENWTADPGIASESHARDWDAVSQSHSLHDLAKSGYLLYNKAFPVASPLRNYLDRLPPGSMIDVNWLQGTSGYVANIPWGLLYRVELGQGRKVDANEFFGLHFRIDYESHPSPEFSRALGRVGNSHVGHAYYWTGPDSDPVLSEAIWQKQQLRRIAPFVSIPRQHQEAAKTELLGWLEESTPAPMPVLYMYCRAHVGTQDQSKLEFGNDAFNAASVTVRELDLPLKPFAQASFVFCNACESGQKLEAQIQNRLENHFFDRGCAAYLGTIHETPIGLASKYAAAFFYFFYGRIGDRITAAGEASAQAKRFLWHRYRNIGGLFYTYVNEYELCMADKAELDEKRRLMARR
jgi:hypothetical protein